MKDLYQTLSVAENADADTIKKAYRKLAKELHPDATGGDSKKTERFKEASDAYAILGDKQKRSEYDRLRHAPVGQDGMPQGFDPETFAQVFGGGVPRGSGARVASDFDLGDLFSSLFSGGANPWTGGGRGRGSGRVGRGSDVLGRAEISFSEAALGTRRGVRTGAGRNVEVTIPAGVESGGRLRLAGQGAPAPGRGGEPGDLHLEINVAPDPHLRRHGHDVTLELPLSIAEATLGTRVDVPTVEGPVRLTIPPGTSSGAKLRLRGKGVKRPDSSRGDQICQVQILVPHLKPDDAETRHLVEELDRRTSEKPPRDF